MDNKEDIRNDPKTIVAPSIVNFINNGNTFKQLTEI